MLLNLKMVELHGGILTMHRILLMKQVAYARVLGMETHVGFSTGTVPPATWLRYPDLRAEDVNYTGITLCWSRGKERILPYQEHLIDAFADVADSFVLWFADPGACICAQCRDYLRVMLDALHTLSEAIDGRAKVTACPWWIENIEAGRVLLERELRRMHVGIAEEDVAAAAGRALTARALAANSASASSKLMPSFAVFFGQIDKRRIGRNGKWFLV